MKVTQMKVSPSKKHVSVKNKWTPRISLKPQPQKTKLKQINSIKKINPKGQIKKRFTCEMCGLRFAAWWEMREHWQDTGHKAPQECRWCIKRTFTLQSHLCKQHWKKAYMCKFCGQLFMFYEDMQRHMDYHTQLQYRCYLCGRRRPSAGLLRTHIYSHYVHEKYGCNLCEKRFKQKKNMEKHLRTVHLVCQYCGSTEKSYDELKQHENIHCDCICMLCLKKFSQKTRLKYHYQLQHGHQDFYKCHICFQRFATKMRLIDHYKLRHGGVAKFSCKICAAPFLYWQQYKNHFEKKHAKPVVDGYKFSCSSCSFKTNLKNKMLWHVEKTTGDGFFCKQCQIPFQCKGTYDVHMEKHRGEKIPCDYCTTSYKSDSSLKQHMMVKHVDIVLKKGGMVYPCVEGNCNNLYATKTNLSRHLRKCHRGGSCRSTPVPTDTSLCHSPSILTSRSPSPRPDSPPLREPEPQPSSSCKEVLQQSDPSINEMADSQCCDSVTDLMRTVEVNMYFCDTCQRMWSKDQPGFVKHMRSHSKRVWEGECDACNLILDSPEDAVRHNVETHLKVQFIQAFSDSYNSP